MTLKRVNIYNKWARLSHAHKCDMGAEACGRVVKPNRKIRNVWSVFKDIPTQHPIISNFICPHCWNTKREFIMRVLLQTAMDAVKIKYQAWGYEKNDIAWPTQKIINAPMVDLEEIQAKKHIIKTGRRSGKATSAKAIPTGKTLDDKNKVREDMATAINEENEVTPETMADLDTAIEESDAKK